MSGKRKRLVGMFVSFILMTAIVAPALAQKRADRTIGSGAAARREVLLQREASIANREQSLRLLREQAGKPKKPTEQDRKLAIRQIFEDFERIQILNNEMMRAASVSQAFDYRRISDVTEEINKRAKRLKINLGITDFEEASKGQTQQVVTEREQVRASLFTLNQLVKSFVTNPLFQNLKVTEVGQLAKARHDLAGIIERSQGLRRSAGKLN